jgi:hypothetical protein
MDRMDIYFTGLATHLRGALRTRVCAAACILVSALLGMPAGAQTDSAIVLKPAQRLQELRVSMRQTSTVVHPRQLSPQERAELRKQLTRELRDQTANNHVR